MTATISITDSNVLTVLRTFLTAEMPPGVEVIDGQDNLVGEPAADDYVVMTVMMRVRLNTNIVGYHDAPGAGARGDLQATQMTVQLDIHGPNSGTNAQVVSTLIRSDVACQAFKASGFDIQPLYAADPIQTPFINGEGQFETRWTVDAVLQVNPIVTTPQDFAAAVKITPAIPADVADFPGVP